jgi:hypothetical protein
MPTAAGQEWVEFSDSELFSVSVLVAALGMKLA